MLAVNKIDLVDYSQEVFDKIVSDFHTFSARLNFTSQVAIPLSARFGINVIEKSQETPWYTGPSLLSHLEIVDVDTALADKPFRLPVQWVNRPNLDFRGFSGTIAGGRGQAGRHRRCRQIRQDQQGHPHRHHGRRSAGSGGGRCRHHHACRRSGYQPRRCLGRSLARPTVSDQFAAHLLWMADEELLPGRQYLLKLGTATIPAQVIHAQTQGRRQQA